MANAMESGSPATIRLALQTRSAIDSMSTANRKIALYFMRHPEHVASMSITRLAGKIGASTSTITRFCQSLGFSGFSQFKYNFDKTQMSTIAARQTIKEGDSIQVIKDKLFNLYQRCIEETLFHMDIHVLERISDMVAGAGKIFFFGQFSNGTTARLGETLLLRVGLTAIAYTDYPLAMVSAAQLGPSDVAFGISSSGRAKLPVDALRLARESGAKTVGITGFTDSLLADYSDVLLCYNLGVEDVRLVHIDRLCETIILGVIQNCVIRNNYGRVVDNLKKSQKAFLEARYPENHRAKK